MSTLPDCPFCGGAPAYRAHPNNMAGIECRSCGNGTGIRRSVGSAEAAWRRRRPWHSSPPRVSGLVLALLSNNQMEVLYYESRSDCWIWPAGVGYVNNVIGWTALPGLPGRP